MELFIVEMKFNLGSIMIDIDIYDKFIVYLEVWGVLCEMEKK